MPLMRGKVVLVLGFVFLTTFLAAVRGLPVRRQRSGSPRERSSKLAEVRQPLGKDGELGGCWSEPSSASAPSPVPGKAEGGGHRGSLGGGCAPPPRREQHPTRVPAGRPPAAPGGKAAAGRSRASCLPASGPPLPWPRGRALSRPWGFSGSLGPLRRTEAAGKGLVSVLGDGGRVP